MATVIRYFDTTASGSGDGTTWANRAALFSSGNWSSIITGFDFGADGLECRLAAGSYSGSQIMNAALFSVSAPTRANPLFFATVDNVGDIAQPPNKKWVSSQPIWNTSTMAYLNLGSATINARHIHFYFVRLQSSSTAGINNTSGTNGNFSWCYLVATGTNTTGIVCRSAKVSNSVIRVESATWGDILTLQSGNYANNVRIEGNASGSSGNRRGISLTGNNFVSVCYCTVLDCQGEGISQVSTSATSAAFSYENCLVYNCGTGYSGAATSLTTNNRTTLQNCICVNSSDWGALVTTGPVSVINCRFRNNASGDFSLGGNNNFFINNTSSGSDSDEFVDHTNRDLRIKNTSGLWGQGYGPGDQEAASTSGGTRIYFG